MAEYCNDPKRAESYGLGDPVEKGPAGEGGVVLDDHDLGGKATIFKPGKSKILPAAPEVSTRPRLCCASLYF